MLLILLIEEISLVYGSAKFHLISKSFGYILEELINATLIKDLKIHELEYFKVFTY